MFVEAFYHCNDTANKLKSESIRAIRLEKEFTTLRFDQKSNLYDAWKQLAGDAHNDTSTVIYQHVLQHFWSCVALQGRTDQSLHEEHRSVSVDNGNENYYDEAEREAIHGHGGWVAKRARDVINSGSTIVSPAKTKIPSQANNQGATSFITTGTK